MSFNRYHIGILMKAQTHVKCTQKHVSESVYSPTCFSGASNTLEEHMGMCNIVFSQLQLLSTRKPLPNSGTARVSAAGGKTCRGVPEEWRARQLEMKSTYASLSPPIPPPLPVWDFRRPSRWNLISLPDSSLSFIFYDFIFTFIIFNILFQMISDC